jgi:L-histidine Nalpha-methyltransferase
MHPALQIDVLLTESSLADRFLSAWAERFLPELFFYWFPLSVRAWLALCRDGPYRNYVRSEALVRAYAGQVVETLPKGPVELISLGSGQGTKDLSLLEGLIAHGRTVTYLPVDSGQALLEMACAQARRCGVPHRGLKADMTDPMHLSRLTRRASDGSRLVVMLGNTLGAFDPTAMLRSVRPLLEENDLLLVDGELGSDLNTRAGYENPANRAFAMAPLYSIGIRDQDGSLHFESSEDVRPGIYRLKKSFLADIDLTLQIGGESLSLRAGETLHMNHSGKYERQAFIKAIAEGGFAPSDEFLSEDGRFLMVLARPVG